jgi:hypothetical protein
MIYSYLLTKNEQLLADQLKTATAICWTVISSYLLNKIMDSHLLTFYGTNSFSSLYYCSKRYNSSGWRISFYSVIYVVGCRLLIPPRRDGPAGLGTETLQMPGDQDQNLHPEALVQATVHQMSRAKQIQSTSEEPLVR